MALGKKTTPKKAAPAAKPSKSPVVKQLSDKEKVLFIHQGAVCIPFKVGHVVFSDKDQTKGKALHSGIASSSDNAWKLAAHNL